MSHSHLFCCHLYKQTKHLNKNDLAMNQHVKLDEKLFEKNKIIAKRGNTYIPLNIRNIALFYSVDRLIFAIDFTGKKFVIDKCLSEIEETVNTRNFFRVNRSCIVNTDYIIKYKNEDGGVLELHDGTEINVGPHRKNELLSLLSKI